MRVKSQISRAHLLQAWQLCKGDPKQLIDTLELFGYEASPDYVHQFIQSKLPTEKEDKPSESSVIPRSQSKPNPPEPRPQLTYYYLAHRERYATEQEAQSEEPTIFKGVSPITDEALASFSEEPIEPIQPRSLVNTNTMTPFIRQRLRQEVGRRLDVKTLVKQVALQAPLKELPTEPRLLPAGRVTVIVDLNQRLLPFWDDIREACDLIKQKHGKIGLDIRVLAHDKPQSDYYLYEDWLIQTLNNQPWEKIPAQSMVFILSDLGQLAPKKSLIRQQWLQFITQLNRRGITPIVLAPIAAEKQCPFFQARTQLILWQRFGKLKSQASRGDIKQHQQKIEHVLSFLSLSPHIEPELLRAFCEKLGHHTGNTGIEADVYLHPHIQWGYTAITLKAEHREHYQQQFKQLPETLKQQIFHCIEQHHRPQFASVWAESILNAEHLMALDPVLVEQAEDIMLRFAKRFSTEASHEGMMRFARRHLSRLKKEQHSDKDYATALHTLAYQSELKAGQPLPPEYNLEIANQILRQTDDKQHYEIRQIGEQLHIVPIGESRYGQVLASFQTVQNNLFINQSLVELPAKVSLSKTIQIDTGQERLTIRTIQRPSWASELSFKNEKLTATLPFADTIYTLKPSFNPKQDSTTQWQLIQGTKEVGSDKYGLFADVTIKTSFWKKDVVQRFRYIEPNTFMMGSPDDEEGRYDDEDYHQVTLTQGYWLADTTCTQALWQAVMGKNPSHFKSNPQNPVESISWLDVQEFLAKLNQFIPNLGIHLPTKAQWENACRTGKNTPFNFEGEINLEKVNYRGLWEMEKDQEGNYPWHDQARQKTSPVKSYPANVWGLYEMHGNVWEWCIDEWQDHLGIEPVTDPANISIKSGVKFDKRGTQSNTTLENTSLYDSTLLANAGDGDVRRVLRGGSWHDYGVHCRSAFRHRLDASSRRRFFGFRIALGHELQSNLVLHSHQDQHRDSDSAVKTASTSEQIGTNPAHNGAAQDLGQTGNGDDSNNVFKQALNWVREKL